MVASRMTMNCARQTRTRTTHLLLSLVLIALLEKRTAESVYGSRNGRYSPVTRLWRDGEVTPRRRAAPPPRVDEGARAERGLVLLRRQEADSRRLAEHHLRGGALPEHRRMLGPRDGHLPDPRRDVHTGVPVLLRPLRQAGVASRPARAASARGDRREDGSQARRRHLGRPRRRARPRRRTLRGHDPRAEAQGSRGDDRGA